jgi:fatty-acyl-CoA synthase
MRGLAFSTLGCPDWSLERALEAGREYGYEAVELRLVDGLVIDAGLAPADRRRVAAALAGSGLSVVALDSSIRLTAPSPPEQIAGEIRAFLDLAGSWSAPVVRVFGGQGEARRASQVLALVAAEAEAAGVAIGLETHDAFSSATAAAAVMAPVQSPAVGVIWDILHTHRMGETPAQVAELIGKRLLGVHIKDAKRRPDGEGWDLVLLGQGEVPVRESLEVVTGLGYGGWLVAEWEKKWHPEIEEPEVALPQHARLLRAWLA